METKKYICLENYINYDGEICFKEGDIYTFTKNGDWYRTQMNNQGYVHKIEESEINLYFNEYKREKTDKVVGDVVNQFKERSKRGIEKYGTTLQENNTDDFLQHFKEELMDAILYIQKLQSQRK